MVSRYGRNSAIALRARLAARNLDSAYDNANALADRVNAELATFSFGAYATNALRSARVVVTGIVGPLAPWMNTIAFAMDRVVDRSAAYGAAWLYGIIA